MFQLCKPEFFCKFMNYFGMSPKAQPVSKTPTHKKWESLSRQPISSLKINIDSEILSI